MNWGRFDKNTGIYAVVDKNRPNDVQGLVAVNNDTDAKLLHIAWSCVAPHNDVWAHRNIEGWQPLYRGVGGHLLAVAVADGC